MLKSAASYASTCVPAPPNTFLLADIVGCLLLARVDGIMPALFRELFPMRVRTSGIGFHTSGVRQSSHRDSVFDGVHRSWNASSIACQLIGTLPDAG
jgi:hypothetical protein